MTLFSLPFTKYHYPIFNHQPPNHNNDKEVRMPNKAFAILYRRIQGLDAGYLYFPLKRNNSPNYAGMPQFFGGTKNANESDRDTIAREMLEESNDQLTLGSGGLTLIHHAIIPANGSLFTFYVAENWSGANFLGPLQNNPEMKSIQKFYALEGGEDTTADLLRSLGIVPSLAFGASETYHAFEHVLVWAQQEVEGMYSEELPA
jgi:8-oxo-dGTP diphosphatase